MTVSDEQWSKLKDLILEWLLLFLSGTKITHKHVKNHQITQVTCKKLYQKKVKKRVTRIIIKYKHTPM